jgi:hypothetical protein
MNASKKVGQDEVEKSKKRSYENQSMKDLKQFRNINENRMFLILSTVIPKCLNQVPRRVEKLRATFNG